LDFLTGSDHLSSDAGALLEALLELPEEENFEDEEDSLYQEALTHMRRENLWKRGKRSIIDEGFTMQLFIIILDVPLKIVIK